MDKIIKHTTCFNEHKKADRACSKETCRHWIDCKKYNNCNILAAGHGERTLQDIGSLCGLTRMRICQIEKSAIKKIKNLLFSDVN